MASGLFTEPMSLYDLLHSFAIDDRHDDGTLFKILITLCVGQTLLGDDELVEKESLGNREANGKAT